MQEIILDDFLNNELSDSFLYESYRSVPRITDGFKPGARKIIYTLLKDGKMMKVSSLAGEVLNETSYIHGQVSLEGACVTLGSNYCGTNNVPLVHGEGNYGTRFNPENSATRYIYAEKPNYLENIFRKEDTPNLVKQNFEGKEIEPVSYYPTLPVFMINSASGIGSGYSCMLFARSIENVITLIKNKLDNKKSSDDLFIPSWRGFNGTVKKIEDNKYEMRGVYKLEGCKLTITELPIGISLDSYIDYLKELKNGKKRSPNKQIKKEFIDKSCIIIQKYDDFSENDHFNFEIILTQEEAKKSIDEIEKDFKLVSILNENTTFSDEKNRIVKFDNIQKAFNYYYNAKMEMLEKRKLSEIERLTKELNYLSEMERFILGVVKNKINVKAKKADLEKQLTEMKFTIIPKLISLPILTLTEEKVEEIKRQVEKKNAELEEMKKQTAKSLWLRDIKELELELKKEGILD